MGKEFITVGITKFDTVKCVEKYVLRVSWHISAKLDLIGQRRDEKIIYHSLFEYI